MGSEMRHIEDRIKQTLKESAGVKLAVAETESGLIAAMAEMIVACVQAGGKVVFLGNGGSAADAQHLAAELVGRFRQERAAIPAIALTINTSILTALGNDYGYEQVFSRQVEALVTEEDVVVGISTSGRSPNVLKAIQVAREKGAQCIGLTGQAGQPLAALCHLCLLVPSDYTARIQETHIAVGHALCELIEEAVTGCETAGEVRG